MGIYTRKDAKVQDNDDFRICIPSRVIAWSCFTRNSRHLGIHPFLFFIFANHGTFAGLLAACSHIFVSLPPDMNVIGIPFALFVLPIRLSAIPPLSTAFSQEYLAFCLLSLRRPFSYLYLSLTEQIATSAFPHSNIDVVSSRSARDRTSQPMSLGRFAGSKSG